SFLAAERGGWDVSVEVSGGDELAGQGAPMLVAPDLVQFRDAPAGEMPDDGQVADPAAYVQREIGTWTHGLVRPPPRRSQTLIPRARHSWIGHLVVRVGYRGPRRHLCNPRTACRSPRPELPRNRRVDRSITHTFSWRYHAPFPAPRRPPALRGRGRGGSGPGLAAAVEPDADDAAKFGDSRRRLARLPQRVVPGIGPRGWSCGFRAQSQRRAPRRQRVC